MKVRIGKYRNPIALYPLFNKWIEFYHKKKYYDVDEKDYTLFDRILDKTCDSIQDITRPISNWWNDSRVVKVKIDHWDTWNLDSTLAYIVLPALKQLKEEKHGSPRVDPKDTPTMPEGFVDPIRGHDELIHKRWEYVLDEMIWAFEQINTDWEEQYWSSHGKREVVKKEGSDLLEWKVVEPAVYDREGIDRHNKRIDNGLRLFGAYYRGLWD